MYLGFKHCSKFSTRVLALVLVVCMLIPSGVVLAQSSFTDIKGHWAEETIEKWLEKGMINGYSDGSFKTEKAITRAEFIVLVNRAMGYKGKATIEFDDVKTNNWFYSELEAAIDANYISGYDNNTFRPNNLVTREQAACIVARIKNLKDNAVAAEKFNDSNKISQWAKPSVGAVVAAGIMQGGSNNTFRPKDSLTRAEAVVTLEKLLQPSDYIITQAGTKLENKTIDGNLIIDKSVGTGEVFLKNVTVKGNTYIYGGGKNSVHFIDCDLYDVYADKENGQVKIVFEGDTKANIVYILSQVILQLSDTAYIKQLIISEEALKSIINLAKDSKVDEIIINSNEIQIIGNGKITIINNNGLTNKSEIKPDKILGNSAGLAIKAPSSGGSSGGTGGGTTPTNVAVTGVTLNKETATMTVGESIELKATVKPDNASNKEVTWSSNDSKIATVDSKGLVTAIKAGNVAITVETKDGKKTDSCNITVSAKPITLQSIAIKHPSSKLAYFVGDELDISSLVVEGTYSDGSKKEISITKSNIYGFDSSKPVANQTLTIKVEDKTVTYDIKILEKVVDKVSEYGFEFIIPDKVIPETEYTVPMTLKATSINQLGYSNALIKVDVTKPQGSTVKLLATDTNNKEWDIAQIGQWGPSNGFVISNNYSETTPVKATFSAEGNYQIALKLVDKANGDNVITTKIIDITVSAKPITDTISIYNPPSVLEVGVNTSLRAVSNTTGAVLNNLIWTVENLDGSNTDIVTIVQNTGLITANKTGTVIVKAALIGNLSISDSYELKVIDNTKNVTLISDPGHNYVVNKGELHIYLGGSAEGKTIDVSKLTVDVKGTKHPLSNDYIKTCYPEKAGDYAIYDNKDDNRTTIVIKLKDSDKNAINNILTQDTVSNCDLIISDGFIHNQTIACTDHLNIQNIYKIETTKDVKAVEHYDSNGLCWTEFSDDKINEIWIGSWETQLVLYTENGKTTRPTTGFAAQITAVHDSNIDTIKIDDSKWVDLTTASVTNIRLDYWGQTVVNCNEGNMIQINLICEPVYVPVNNIEWSSSNRDIATVDENGIVTALKEGNATITAEVNGLSDSIDIKVVNDIFARLVLNNNELQIANLYNIPDPNNNIIDFSKINISNGEPNGSYRLKGAYDFIGWDKDVNEKGKYSIIYGSRLYISLNDEDYNGIKALLSVGKPLTLTINDGLHPQIKGVHDNIQIDTTNRYSLPESSIVRLINLFDNNGQQIGGWYTPKNTMDSFLISTNNEVKYIVLLSDWEDINTLDDILELEPPLDAQVALIDAETIQNYTINDADIKWEVAGNVKVTSVSIAEYGKNTVPTKLKVGDIVELTAIFNPLHGYKRDLQWGSNSDCITIDKFGKLTANKAGKATIQVAVITPDNKSIFTTHEITVITDSLLITDSQGLLDAIENSIGGEELILDGTIGDVNNYTIYYIDKPITIKSTTDAKVYGSFIINTDNVTIEGLTIENKYVDGNESASKNAINVYADYVNITNNTITTSASAENYEPNGIVIFPKSDLSIPYQGQGLNLINNKLIGYNKSTTDNMYASAGILVAEDYPMIKKPFFRITDEKVKSMKLDGDYYQNVNEFKNCAYGYVRISGFDWSKPAVGQIIEFALVQNEASLQNSIKYANKKATILVDKGEYDLIPTKDIIEQQSGWYLPILQDGLVLEGKNNPVLTSSTYTQNGNWATQNLITVWGNDVTIDGITIKCKEETNKAIEVLGNNFTLKNSLIAPRTDALKFAGSIYFNQYANKSATIENTEFNLGRISLSGADSSSTLNIKNVKLNFAGSNHELDYWAFWNPNKSKVNANNLVINMSNQIAPKLQDALNELPQGTKVILEAGTYYVSSKLVVPTGVELDASKATIIELNETVAFVTNAEDLKAKLQDPLVTMIHLANGTYNVGTGITIPSGVTVKGGGKDLVTIISADTTGDQSTVTLSGTLEGVTVAYKPTRVAGTAWLKENPIGVTILEKGNLINCKITGHRNGVYANNVTNITISNNDIQANRTGIQFANAVGAKVTNNIIQNNETIGVLLQHLSANNGSIPTFSGNTITNNWSSDFENRWSTDYVVSLDSNTFTGDTKSLVVAPNSSEGSSQSSFTKADVKFIANIVTSKLSNITISGATIKNMAYIKTGENTVYYTSIQDAVNAALENEVVNLTEGTFIVNNTITVDKPIAIQGTANYNSKIVTTGSNPVFNLKSSCIIDSIYIEKQDKTSQNLISIAYNNVTIKNSKFIGKYILGDNEESRAFVTNAGIANFELSNNTIEALRQPGYLEGTGKVIGNIVTGTRGWVVCVNYLIDLKANQFSENAVDIAIIANKQTASDNYTDVAKISSDNNGAYVENQLTGAKAKNGVLIPVPKIESITSNVITNFNYKTIESTQAKIESKVITSSNFGPGNEKSFTINDGKGNNIPVDLCWDIPLNEYATTPAAALGSAVESFIQQYFIDKGGNDGLMNRTLYANNSGDKFYIGSFASGSSSNITISGVDASYFFDTFHSSGTDYDSSLNRTFKISDGTITVIIFLADNYTNMTYLVNSLNSMLIGSSIKVKAEKVDDTHFKLITTEAGIHITIDGVHKAEFFSSFISN